jgi:hypothetical protein
MLGVATIAGVAPNHPVVHDRQEGQMHCADVIEPGLMAALRAAKTTWRIKS